MPLFMHMHTRLQTCIRAYRAFGHKTTDNHTTVKAFKRCRSVTGPAMPDHGSAWPHRSDDDADDDANAGCWDAMGSTGLDIGC
ncbi:unnamed protein product [Ceratitis capitata]|uniref:(Mediterranean fruit fly) hypothetical protein n=1 Tax=Ceratitis capitata TaxID=7213 RepID=A0A811V3E6_CERCA|nr:unnamed protein product [Ceratitis capitata]